MKTALIIGSGVAGLASAIRLARKGYKVTILEKNDYPGGKLTSFEMNGFRFDAGPSLFTLPHLVLELLDNDLKEEFKYEQLINSCLYLWNDKERFLAPSNASDFVIKGADHFKIDEASIKKYLKKADWKFSSTKEVFLESNIHKWQNYFTKKFIKSYINLPFLGIFKSYHKHNEELLKNKKLVQILDRLATYNGSSPFRASAVYSLLAHLEFNGGTYFPKNGMHDITKILVKQCNKLGVEIKYNAQVKSFDKTASQITALSTDNERFEADLFISNIDALNTYKNLLKESLPKSELEERSSSGLVFYWGIADSFEELELHNIFFADNYEDEFKAIFESKTLVNDPTIYLHRSCAVSSNDAPKGKENWFVMINVPSEPDLFNEENILKIKNHILSKLSRLLNKQISNLIECEKILSPRDIEINTGAFKGALYGASSNSQLASFKRHPNHSKYSNLYFAGGTVHPGGGIPLCLLSAKIVTDEL